MNFLPATKDQGLSTDEERERIPFDRLRVKRMRMREMSGAVLPKPV